MTKLHLFRMINGERRPVTFILDADRLILDEIIGEAPAVSRPPANEIEQHLRDRGVSFHKDEAGRTLIDKVPAREQEIISFFSLQKPCWFPGCEELRKQYQADYEAIGGANCKACDHGALLRKYMAKVDAILPRTT